VNCGLPETGRSNWRPLARATAAHSTVTFNQTSSCEFFDGRATRRLFGTLVSGGPTRVTARRDVDEHAIRVSAEHDGYADRYGIVHQRTVLLATDGSRLEGEDVFLPARGESLPAALPDTFAVRFHLHPSVRVTVSEHGHGAVLTLPNEDVWNFYAYEDEVVIEESVYLGGRDGPRRTAQIVIHGHARKAPRIEWTFAFKEAAVAVGAEEHSATDGDDLAF
jgi:uncharacterized heparinase superfamily protein